MRQVQVIFDLLRGNDSSHYLLLICSLTESLRISAPHKGSLGSLAGLTRGHQSPDGRRVASAGQTSENCIEES
ncbi:hypothetical protein E2C01_048836 [Portunus trituberculatus]|uniref:Uncharacterized protein n=1 Tax=Portunus trituberculatus TaxID=210409 RepID=A0A5B7GC91_PORTR|nr:hypothetical protein [Portunus trituberculatus]